MYIKDSDNSQIVTYAELKAELAGMSIPPGGTEEIAGWFIVHFVAEPTYDKFTQSVSKGLPGKIMGSYFDTWIISSLSPTEAAAAVGTAKADKWEEIWQHAGMLKQQAEASMVSGMGSQPSRNSDRLEKRFLMIVDKKVQGLVVTPAEEVFYSLYEALLTFSDSTDTIAMEGCTSVNIMVNGNSVEAFDVSGLLWPTWS